MVASSSPCFSQKRFSAFAKPDVTKVPPFDFFGIVRFFQMNIFCLKIRFPQAQARYIRNFQEKSILDQRRPDMFC